MCRRMTYDLQLTYQLRNHKPQVIIDNTHSKPLQQQGTQSITHSVMK